MNGLNKFDRDTGQFVRYKHDPADPSSLSHNVVFMVFEDQAGILWIGTWGWRLNKFEREIRKPLGTISPIPLIHTVLS